MEKFFELLILTGETNAIGIGTAKGKQYRMPILAYVVKDTGELVEQKTILTWSAEQKFHFEKQSTYYIKAVTKIDENLESATYPKRFTVLDVISDHIKNEELLEILQKYKEPIIKRDDGLGEFILNKRFNVFEARVTWLGSPCDVWFNCVQDLDDYDICLNIFKSIYLDLTAFDKKIKDFACEQLLKLANEWNEEENLLIAKGDFIDSLLISSCEIFKDGDYELMYSCGEIFFGHVIRIKGNVETGLKSATLAG